MVHVHSGHHSHHDHSHPSRREFLTGLVGLAGLSVLETGYARAALARAQAPRAPVNLFDLEAVGEGVFVALARPAAFINSNAAIFVDPDQVVVMDTHSKPSAAAALIAQIRRQLTEVPVRYVVNSHFHWDHTQGNSAYRQAFSDVKFVASTATSKLLEQETNNRLKRSLEQLPALIEKTRKSLEQAKDAQEKEFYQRLLTEQEAYGKEMSAFNLEVPSVTVDKTHVLRGKRLTLNIDFHGRAHTAGDVVIFCPERRVVATGDMVHAFLPYIADGYPKEWPRTIDNVGKLGFEKVIGGHGPVHTDRIRFKHMRDYIEELTARVAEGKKAGKPVAELQKTITAASLRSLQTDNYGVMVEETLARFTPVLTKPSLDDGIKSNIQDVYTTLDR